MTPKEKAIELVSKFDKAVNTHTNIPLKKCALITVDEVLNLCWNGNLKAQQYWQDVKQEIEKL